MKKTLVLLTLVSFLGSLFSSPAFGSNPTTGLVSKIQKSGIGCVDAKLAKTKIMFSPTRTTCSINGEKVNIEVYSSANFKKANNYLCSSGFDVPLLTDKKTWSISPDSEATMQAIQKVVGGFIVNTCSLT